MEKLTYFPLVLDRWIAGTRHMTFEEKGMYLDLLIYLYEKPDRYLKDEAHMARILGCRPQKVRRIWPHISEKFRRFSGGFTHSLVRELQRNGMKFRGLQRAISPTKPDPEEEEEKKEEKLKQKEERKPASQRAQNQSPRQQGTNPRKLPPLAEPLPVDGVDMDAWTAYEDYRRERHLPKLKPVSVTRLQRWLTQQSDQAAVVDQTIRNGWTGLFELKTQKPRNNTYRGRDENLEAMAAQLGLPAKPGESTEAWHMRIRAAATRAH